MKLRKTILLIALTLYVPAYAGIVTIIEAVETVTSNMSVPTSANGRLMFRPCDEGCNEQFVAVRLTEDTVYIVRQQPVNFADFRKAFVAIRRSEDDYALINYDVNSKTASRVSIGF